MLTLLLLAGLSQINCPEWLPGTDQVLPMGVTLSREQKIKNNLKCYCKIVKPAEIECLKIRSPELCTRRTSDWIRDNITNIILPNQTNPLRWRLVTIEP